MCCEYVTSTNFWNLRKFRKIGPIHRQNEVAFEQLKAT